MPQRLLPVVMFSLIALLILFSPLKRAHADSDKADLHAPIDGYSVELVFPDGQPKAGPNTVLVRLHDASDLPLSNARVQVAAVAVQSAAADLHGQGESGHDGASTGGHDTAADSHNAAESGHGHAAAANQPDTHADNPVAPHADAAKGDHGHTTDDEHVDTIMTQMEAGIDAGAYISVLHFDSAGAWQVQLQFTAAGADHAGSFAVTVIEPARDWRILGAFGGANALIIMTAAVLKRHFPTTAKHTRGAVTSHPEN